MDRERITQIALEIRSELKKRQIRIDTAILFGSQAKGTADKDSDIDLALISEDFGRDRIREMTLVNFIASKIDWNLEVLPISLKSYLNSDHISPILEEIKKYGVVLF